MLIADEMNKFLENYKAEFTPTDDDTEMFTCLRVKLRNTKKLGNLT